jgi:Raf kinase inhibitor-like YbhB/YbcL family protein
MKRILMAAGLLALAGTAMAQAPAPAPAPVAMKPVGMTLSSPDFQDGGILDDKYTSKVYVGGKPIANSPALHWTGTPAGTQSFALIVHDLDVQLGKGLGDNLHWFAWNIPGTATSLPQSVPTVAKLPDGTQQNRWGSAANPYYGWGGPGAPAPIYHHYVFEIWALDTRLELPESANRADLQKAMDGHVLDKGFTVARFHR